MKKFTVFKRIFVALGLLLSHVGCIAVSFNYRHMICENLHGFTSFPEWVAFYTVIPYAVGVVLCLAAAFLFYRLERRHKNAV